MVRRGCTLPCATIWLGMSLGILTGCANLANRPIEESALPAHRETLDRERAAEVTALRADMAATRIASAKKEAELIELRATVQQLRQDNAELHQVLLSLRRDQESRQIELERLRAERAQGAHVAHTEAVSVLQAQISSLTADVDRLKDELSQALIRRSAKLTSGAHRKPAHSADSGTVGEETLPARAMEDAPTAKVVPAGAVLSPSGQGDAMKSVTVQTGDTLWSLARRYRMTVGELRRLNRIDGDVLLVGQVLNVAVARSVER